LRRPGIASPALASRLRSRFSFRARAFLPDIALEDKSGWFRVRVVCASLCVEASERRRGNERTRKKNELAENGHAGFLIWDAARLCAVCTTPRDLGLPRPRVARLGGSRRRANRALCETRGASPSSVRPCGWVDRTGETEKQS
jgi:PAS domain-containing protein